MTLSATQRTQPRRLHRRYWLALRYTSPYTLSILASLLVLAAILIGLAIKDGRTTLQADKQPIKVGLIAPFTGPLSASGEAIRRGILLAMDEVNRTGGVNGRPLELVIRDVQNDGKAGEKALRELVAQEQIVAVFGGIYSQVMIDQLDAVHELEIPLIDPWGSMSGITYNNRDPNYAFRVSISDDQADQFLARYAVEVLAVHNPGILADTSTWGDANLMGLAYWLRQMDIEPAAIERFDQGTVSMSNQLDRLRSAGADSILMVANAPEGAAIVRGLSVLGWQVPVVSHWGISGGRFVELAGRENAEGVYTVQTYSFLGRLDAKGRDLLNQYHERFGTHRAVEILAPVGVVHGYDGLHLLVQAIEQAGTTDGAAVQRALEDLPPYNGLVKNYVPAFTAKRHDALLAEDYMMTVWHEGRLLPAPQAHLEMK